MQRPAYVHRKERLVTPFKKSLILAVRSKVLKTRETYKHLCQQKKQAKENIVFSLPCTGGQYIGLKQETQNFWYSYC